MKVGDKVKCVSCSQMNEGGFTVGNNYTAFRVDDTHMTLLNDHNKEVDVRLTDSLLAKFDPVTEKQPEQIDKGEKYQREISPGVFVDIYDVLEAWGVSCPARQHAIKKLLAAGKRGHKSEVKDLQEAHNSAHRAIMLQIERGKKTNGKPLPDSIAD